MHTANVEMNILGGDHTGMARTHDLQHGSEARLHSGLLGHREQGPELLPRDARGLRLLRHHPPRTKTVDGTTRASTASQVLLSTLTATTGTNLRTGTMGTNPRTGDTQSALSDLSTNWPAPTGPVRWRGTNPTCKDCSGTTRTRTACHCEETQELRRALLRDSALCEETPELRRATTDSAVAHTHQAPS